MSTNWENEIPGFFCPVCGSKKIVPPSGKETSKVLLIGFSPGQEEIEAGRPFAGPSGAILKAELGYHGIDYRSLRVCNVWQHKENNKDACFQEGMKVVFREALGKSLIILVGAQVTELFCGKPVEKWNGLFTHSQYFSIPVFIMVQPSTAFHGGIGEFRMAIEKVSRKMEALCKTN